MKILIFYASYGGGHLNAAKSIETCLKKNYQNFDVELIDCMKYVNLPLEKITTSAYREITKKAPWAWGRIYADSQKGPLAHISSRANKILAIKLLKLLRKKNPDIIISTHFFGSQMCSYLKRKGKIHAKIATIMTDFAPHGQWLVGNNFIDYFFVAHDNMRDSLISQGIDGNKIFATGIPISDRFLANYDRHEVLESFGLKDGLKTVLFFGGGEFGLGKARTVEIFESLIRYVDNIQIVAVAGKNERMKSHFMDVVERNHKEDSVKVLGFTNQVPELMSISDLVVTKPGGLTTSESLACNLPMVIINPLPGQEEENAALLESKGIAVWLRKEDEPRVVFEDLFAHPEKLELMKENTNLLGKKFASEDICRIVISE